MRYRLLLLLLVGVLGLPFTASAVALTTVDVRQALTDLPARKLPEAEQLVAQQTLEQTLTWLDAVERTEQAQQQLEQQLASAPQQITEAQEALQRLLAAPEQDPSQGLLGLSVAELENLLAERNQQLKGLKKT